MHTPTYHIWKISMRLEVPRFSAWRVKLFACLSVAARFNVLSIVHLVPRTTIILAGELSRLTRFVYSYLACLYSSHATETRRILPDPCAILHGADLICSYLLHFRSSFLPFELGLGLFPLSVCCCARTCPLLPFDPSCFTLLHACIVHSFLTVEIVQ